ncbi:hypothetical protein DM558_02960 [Entomomonas moraniae]|uniref:TNase-like domain-containing protein n=1 Tax=Entomomonas moraniae TaxID=2213226 RepID=A0A3S9XBJ8_9GAMM|nr:thermonuclease family protein [Entomomonas moraniae]AZS49803.1 hypothetical protein DM558_02960 [Entomomonas moraniae]
MLNIFFCMILSVNNGGSLVANCRPENKYIKQEFNNITLMVADIDAPFNNQLYAEESKQNLTKLCLNKEAEVEVHLYNNQFIFGAVSCENKDVAKFQVASGMAKVSENSKFNDNIDSLLEYEQKAQNQKVGIWKNITPK